MSRWNPVVFRRCACTAGACPSDLRFEARGRTSAAVHVVVHQGEVRPGPGRPAEPGVRGLPFLLLGLAALLLATFDTRAR